LTCPFSKPRADSVSTCKLGVSAIVAANLPAMTYTFPFNRTAVVQARSGVRESRSAGLQYGFQSIPN
jgi:hypothetical protein